MFSTLRTRFGIPGVISVIALVFAMLGGAYAAQSSNSGKATASAKAKKGPRGPKGPKGDPGPAGPQGPAGANGKDGANGTNGVNGSPGVNGKSAVTGTATAAECAEGGITIEVESTPATKKHVCNGSPWTATGTLPAGATETGAWSAGPFGPGALSGSEVYYAPISFAIPLDEGLDRSHVHFIDETGQEVIDPAGTTQASTVCLGTAVSPSAEPGNLCVYTVEAETFSNSSSIRSAPSTFAPLGTTTAGALLPVEKASVNDYAFGTWAVTAEE